MGLYRHSRLTLSNAVLCGGLLFSLAASVLAAESLQWVVISNGETVGTLDVQREGNSVDIAYRVDNNGRGPKTDEKLQLDERGIPLSWRVTGTSLFGAAVSESYTWDDGVAQWQSQADAGSITIDQPPMYIGGDVSPWSLGMYARAALKAPDQSLDVLPSGRLKLQQLGKLDISNDLTVTVYGLSGIQLDLQLIALDPAGQFFASLGGRGAVIRKGFEDSVPALQEWSRGFELQRMEELQSRLAVHTDLPVRYLNVRVFDSKAQATGALVSVVVSDGIIQSIEPADTRGAEGTELLVDGQGGTLVPGLYDMHAHNSMDSGLFYLAAGVTSTRDMGNDNALLTEIRRATEQGELAGPRIAPAGLIEARSPYSARIGIVADTLEQALEAVRWYAAEGYSEIKTYNSMNPEWVPPIVAEAKALGLRVSGHVPAFMDPDEITLVGYDSIAHINQLMLGWLLEEGEDTRSALRLTAMQRAAELDLQNEDVQESVRLMAENGTSLDTTAVILERLMLSRSGEIQPGDLPYLSHMPIGYQRYRKRTFVPLDEPGADVAYREAFQTLLQVVKLLYDNGVGLLIGTDDTTGFTVHRELELYVQAGIPAPAVLSIATLGAATYLGQQDQLGNIEPGKLADFFLVPGDPTEDISLVRQIQLVSRGGVLYFPAQIYTELGIEPFAPPAAILPAETAPAESGPSWFDPTRVSDAPLHSPARTSHKGEFNGVDVSYDAITRELMLHGADGAPAATIFSTAYVRTDIGDTSKHPVLFLFNGGPGASSSPLHLGLGPMRRPEGDDEGALVSNPDSVLDTVDMVFIDPAGTGYTRLITEDAGGQFWGVNEDADAVLYLMHQWLVENDRLESPVFVMGESYGGTRAAVIADRASQVNISGLILLSPALDFTAGVGVVGNNLPYIFLLPSMAATAVYHGVVDADGRSYLEVFNQAADYAQSTYAAALFQGNTIDPEAKAQVAARLASLTGLNPDYILENNLRIQRNAFGDRLLGKEGMRVGRLDARAKGPIAEYKDKRPPGNDPSMSGKPTGGRSMGEVLDEYFATHLNTLVEWPYRTLNLDLNLKWNYGQKDGLTTYFSVAPQLQSAMNNNPDLRVFVGGGVFDLGTPIMSARYVTQQIDTNPDRFVFAGYEGGHTVFEHEASRVALGNDIRSFVRESLQESGMAQADRMTGTR